MFQWEGTWVNLWLIQVDVWQKPMQYYKAIILQLKISKILKTIILQKLKKQISVENYTIMGKYEDENNHYLLI